MTRFLRLMLGVVVVATFAFNATPLMAQVTFSFANEDPFDSGVNPSGAEDRDADPPLAGVVGSTSDLQTDVGNGLTATFSTIDIIGADGTFATDFDPVDSPNDNFHETNVLGSGFFAVNTDQDQDTGLNTDAGQFNPGEGWVFAFSEDVELLSFTLGGIDIDATTGIAEELVTLSSDSLGVVTLGDNNNVFDSLSVLANEEITLSFVSTTGDDNFNVDGFQFSIVDPNAPAVPEPTSTALLGLGSIAIFARRRRA